METYKAKLRRQDVYTMIRCNLLEAEVHGSLAAEYMLTDVYDFEKHPEDGAYYHARKAFHAAMNVDFYIGQN